MQQLAFSLGRAEHLAGIRDRLRRAFPDAGSPPVLSPMAQLVKSIISSRTRDTVSWPAFFRLTRSFPDWRAMMDASPDTIEAGIFDVTHAGDKAGYLLRALRIIGAEHPDFDLRFLADMPLEAALAWLQRLPGVGPKVSASVMNFSTIARPSFVIDNHVLRLLKRIGLVGPRADTANAYYTIMEILPGWTAGELAELHTLLKRLGQTSCTHRNARCARCPINRACRQQH